MTRIRARFLAALFLAAPFMFATPFENVQASTPSSPSYQFNFDGNFTDSAGTATATATPAPTTSTFSNLNGDGYWSWTTSTDAGLRIGNYSITETYTIIMDFTFDSLTNYKRILNFSEGDTGLYFLNSNIYYYPNSSTLSAVNFLANERYKIAFVRTPTTYAVYASSTSQPTMIQIFSQPTSGYASMIGHSTFHLFYDLGGSEFATSGKIYSLSIWNDRALTLSEAASFQFNPLTPTFQLIGSTSTATYRAYTSVDTQMNLSGKVTYLVGTKRIPGCTNLATIGSGNSYTSRCNWRPSQHGPVLIKVVFVPSDNTYPQMTLLRNYTVTNRIGSR